MKGGGGGGQLGFGKVSLQEGSAPIYKLSIALPRGGGYIVTVSVVLRFPSRCSFPKDKI